MVKESYDEMEKEALKAWNADMLIDIFPQKEEFEKENYSPLWSLTLPDELNQILSNLRHSMERTDRLHCLQTGGF